MQGRRFFHRTHEGIHAREPTCPWIQPSGAVIIESCIGIECFAGEQIRIGVLTLVSEQLTECGEAVAIGSSPTIVRECPYASQTVRVVVARLPRLRCRARPHYSQQVIAAYIVRF